MGAEKHRRVRPSIRFVPVSTSSRLVGDEDMGFVLAKSLFTHWKEIDARCALGEIARVLTRGRSALIAAFLFEEGSPPEKVFPFADAARDPLAAEVSAGGRDRLREGSLFENGGG